MLNLDDIRIPDEDADKPADINLDPNVGDDGIGGGEDIDPNKKVETKSEDNKETPPDPAKPADDPNKPADPSKDPVTDPDKKPEDDKKDTLPPFHEHPDWIKSQEEKKQLETKLANLEGKIEILTQGNKGIDNVKENAQVTAKAKIQEKLDAGWKPETQLEVVETYGDFLLEEIESKLKAKDEAENKAKQEMASREKEISKQVDDTLDKLEIKDDKDRDAVINQVLAWKNEGMGISIKTLEVAADLIKSKGIIGKPPVTEPTPEDKDKADKEAADKKAREDANKLINRPKSDGDKTTPQKGNYKDIHTKDLDTIIAEQSANL